MKEQITIAASTGRIEGARLERAGRTWVRFHPAGPDEGLRFIRADLPGAPEIACGAEQLRDRPRWTALEQDGVWIHHTEHALAALAFAGVDNCRIEVGGENLPMPSGGGCAEFVRALRAAGRRALGAPRRVYALKEPVFFLDAESTEGRAQADPPLRDGRYVLAVPADVFSVSYVFHWSHLPTLPLGVAEYEAGRDDDDPALLSARSYVVETERAQVKEFLGSVEEELLALHPGGPPAGSAEAARHKIVDFIGDLMILGRPVVGRFAAFRTGHRIHHDLVRHLLKNKRLDLRPA